MYCIHTDTDVNRGHGTTTVAWDIHRTFRRVKIFPCPAGKIERRKDGIVRNRGDAKWKNPSKKKSGY